MKKLAFLLTAVVAFAVFNQTTPIKNPDGENLSGLHRATLKIFDAAGREIATIEDASLRFENGYIHNITEYLPGDIPETVWIEIDGTGLSAGRIRYESDSPTLRRGVGSGGDIMETMDDELQIGQVGDELYVASDVTGFGNDAPDERVVVDGKLSLSEGTGATPTTGFGKVYVKSDDGHLYYMADDSTEVDLTVDANAVQSVSSSANTTGRTAHMRYIPGESTEIMESATDDTIFIQHNVNVTGSGGSTPCSDPPDAPSTVVGPTTVCEMAEGVAYSVPPVDGATYYFWDLPTESYIASGSGSNSVIVNFGSTDGNIEVSSYNSCGTSASPATLGISMNYPPLMPGSITGESSVCEGATEVYSISPVTGAVTYTWSLPSGAFVSSGYGTNTVSITFASSSGTVCVTADNACGSSEPQCLPVTVFGSLSGTMPGAITGPSSVCSGATDVAYSISELTDATSYSWTVPMDASIVSGTGTNSILVDFGATGGNVTVTAANSCGSSDSRVLGVSVSPNTVGGSVDGASDICLGSSTGTMTLSGNVGAVTKWQKSRDGGGWVDISRTEITYSETPTLAGDWSYRAEVRSGACSAVFSTEHTVTVAPTTVGGAVVGGSTPICLGSSTGSMTLTGYTGSIQKWQRSSNGGSTWTDIVHTDPVYSTTPSSSGTWLYRGVVKSGECASDNSTPVSIEVNPNTVAGAVSGGTSPICIGSSTGTLTLSGHTGDILNWQKSSDGGSTWTDISHTSATYSEIPSSSGTWSYRAVVQSGACSSLPSTSVDIDVDPTSVAGSISGGTSAICLGSSTGTMTLSGHTGDILRWQRTTDGGSSWTDITHTAATYSETPGSEGIYQYRAVVQSGVCSVVYSSASTAISVRDVLPAPGSITGNTSVCEGSSETYSITPVSGATGYSWTVPSGSSITSGAGTESITVLFGGTSGDICVTADSACGSSSPTCESITVNALGGGSVTFSATGSGRTGTIQTWTVPPCVTSVTIEAFGAQGGTVSGAEGGHGARMQGTFTVTPGEIIKILVGHQGVDNSDDATGGGGGTFVVRNDNTPMIIAGGGGGRRAGASGTETRRHAVTSTSAQASSDGTGAGGTAGNGGSSGEPSGSGTGGPGGGFYTDGGPSGNIAQRGDPGIAFLSGGQGGQGCTSGTSQGTDGGFGGGGGATWCYRGTPGGGGGYSGGGSGVNDTAGGGGGSYNAGTAQSNTNGSSVSRTGHGQVTITY